MHKIPAEKMQKLCALLSEKMALHYNESDWAVLEAKLEQMSQHIGHKDVLSCVDGLIRERLSSEQMEGLAAYLTIGETYFFRDDNMWGFLENELLPKWINKRRENGKFLRIWSAACCTGEELYSMAILLHQLIPHIADWKITLLGTDINVNFLRKAEQAIYKSWSFRSIKQDNLSRYFRQVSENRYLLSPEIRKLVHFRHLNLAEDTYPSLLNGTNAMDIILCNNVLIYFAKQKIPQVTHQLADALIDEGNLLVSPLEVPYIVDDKLVPVRRQTITYFEKGPERAAFPQKTEHQTHKKGAGAPVQRRIKKAVSASENEQKKETKVPLEVLAQQFERGDYHLLVSHLEAECIEGGERYLQNEPHRLRLLIKSLANLGELERAQVWGEKAIAVEKLDSSLYFIQASIFSELNRVDESIKLINKAIYLDPDFVIAYYFQGHLFLKMGKEADAGKSFRNALSILQKMQPDSLLKEGEGLTAGILMDSLRSV